jgi:hypothetical protein
MQINPRHTTARQYHTAAPQADPHLALAGRLLDQAQLDRGQHVLLAENLATYLSHQVSRKRAVELQSAAPEDLLPALRQSKWRNARWITKIERDLQAPYSDGEVWRSLDGLQGRMLDYVSYVRDAAGHQAPMTIYFTGSMAKGRMGANSDVDAYADVPDVLAHGASVQYFEQHATDHVLSIATLPREGNSYRSYLIHSHADMPHLTADAIQHDSHALQELYRTRLAQRGYHVACSHDGQVRVTQVASPPRRHEQPVLLDFLIGEATKRKLQPPRKLEELTEASATRGSRKQAVIRSVTHAVGVAAAGGLFAPVVRRVLQTIRA